MTPEEYAASQLAISAATASYVQKFGSFFTNPALNVREWLKMLQVLYPEVEHQRERSANLAREFYDSQRAQVVPNLPRNDRPLESYNFRRFAQNMEPARKPMSQAESPDHAVSRLVLQATREVENAGRRQIIHAVEDDEILQEFIEHPTEIVHNDPEPRVRSIRELIEEHIGQPLREEPEPPPEIPDHKVEEPKPRSTMKLIRGWARVATGRETCAWCLMLVSRGPVYSDAGKAGLDLPDWEATKMVAAGEDVSEYMDQWHPGCDCKVVPVFKYDTWAGKAAAKRAEDLWVDATREARRLIDSGEARSENLNRETQNALRRRLYRGEIDMSEFAGFAA